MSGTVSGKVESYLEGMIAGGVTSEEDAALVICGLASKELLAMVEERKRLVEWGAENVIYSRTREQEARLVDEWIEVWQEYFGRIIDANKIQQAYAVYSIVMDALMVEEAEAMEDEEAQREAQRDAEEEAYSSDY